MRTVRADKIDKATAKLKDIIPLRRRQRGFATWLNVAMGADPDPRLPSAYYLRRHMGAVVKDRRKSTRVAEKVGHSPG